MRKITIVTILGLLFLGGVGLFVKLRPYQGEIGLVRELSEKFMEDLQFKDFRSSSLYHHVLDQGRIDIGRALEDLFLVKPELLDIMRFRPTKVELDSTGKRARVVITTTFRILNKEKKPREGEVVLYWIKRHPDCPLGADCVAGACQNERGQVQFKPKAGGDQEKSRRKGKFNEAPQEHTEEPYACDVTKQAQWFMNIDSTLKQKDYR